MVVSTGIENVTLALKTPVGVQGEKVSILVSMVANLLPKTVALIDFGDGIKRQIGFRCRDNECHEDTDDSQVEGSVTEADYTAEAVTYATTSGVSSSWGTTASNDADWENLELMETYSYSLYCQLLFEVSHTYVEEGYFQPSVSASDGLSNVSASLDGSLMIANKLMSVIIRDHVSIEAVGRNVSFTAATESPSVFVSYFWQVTRADSTVVLERWTANSSVLFYVFLESGLYQIEVNASNPVDSVSTTSDIVIEAPVQNLRISCFNVEYIPIYQPINCSATVDSGTDIDFKWSFCDTSRTCTRPGNKGLSSNVIHRFFTLGPCSVSVNASNSIGWVSGYLPYAVVVLEPVLSLWNLLPPPALLGGPTTFEARAEAGVSDFVIEFDFGDSSEIVIMNASTGIGVRVLHQYTRVGSFRVNVSAWNEVSKIRKRFDVDILEDIPDVHLAVVGSAPVNGRRTVFAAYVDGKLIRNSFLWQFIICVGND